MLKMTFSMQAGADPNAADVAGRTPISYAAARGSLGMDLVPAEYLS